MLLRQASRAGWWGEQASWPLLLASFCSRLGLTAVSVPCGTVASLRVRSPPPSRLARGCCLGAAEGVHACQYHPFCLIQQCHAMLCAGLLPCRRRQRQR